MYICDRCGCWCDAGEIHGGICDDCLEESRQKEIRAEENRLMRKRCITEQTDGQLVLMI